TATGSGSSGYQRTPSRGSRRTCGGSSTRPRKNARRRRRPRQTSSARTSMRMEASHGGTDLSRRGRARHRPGNGAGSRGCFLGGRRGQGGGGVKNDGRALETVRPERGG